VKIFGEKEDATQKEQWYTKSTFFD